MAKKKLKWTFYHLSVFVLTFWSYACFHATRKTFSNVKDSIQDVWTPTFHNETINVTQPDDVWNKQKMFENGDDAAVFLGALDTVFMISYAVGLYVSGFVGDRLDLRYVLSFGMCMSGLMVFMFGTMSEWIKCYSVYWYTPFYLLNGLLQASGWPTVVAIMGNWFGKSSRGLVFGLWSACASVGNIVGAAMVAAVLQYGYEYTFLVSSSTLFAGGVIAFFGLVPSPRDVGLPEPDEDDDEEDTDATALVLVWAALTLLFVISIGASLGIIWYTDPVLPTIGPLQHMGQCPDGRADAEVHTERPKAIGFFRAFLLPGVLMYSLCYACLKLVNYSFFFWLPYYLHESLHWSPTVADEISIWYDVGGIVAGILGGVITDYFRQRSPTVVGLLLLAFPALWLYSASPDDKTINSVLLAVTGFFIGGPANLISSAISADLGRQGPIKGNSEALATVTGIVDGTGSVGAAIGLGLVPIIEEHLDWHWVFYFFILMNFLTIVCISPILYRDFLDSRVYTWLRVRVCGRGPYNLQTDEYNQHIHS